MFYPLAITFHKSIQYFIPANAICGLFSRNDTNDAFQLEHLTQRANCRVDKGGVERSSKMKLVSSFSTSISIPSLARGGCSVCPSGIEHADTMPDDWPASHSLLVCLSSFLLLTSLRSTTTTALRGTTNSRPAVAVLSLPLVQ